MIKKIWFFNHYSQPVKYYPHERTYQYAKNLQLNGFITRIFCSSKVHNSSTNLIENRKQYIEINDNNIDYTIIKTSDYTGNGVRRIINMMEYTLKLFILYKKYDRPDLIIATSVHPLTCYAGIKIARKLKIPCIIEIADLWPQSFIAYKIMKPNNPLLKVLFRLEKWLYENASKIIFTMEAGKDYIIEKKWDVSNGGNIPLSKIHIINNGIDLEQFIENKSLYKYIDDDIENDNFKVIYTGSLRMVNNVQKIIDTAKYISNLDETIVFLIFGGGNQEDYLKKYTYSNKVKNVIFKGAVDKKYIPYILSKSNLNIFHFQQSELTKYGASLNKIFEYFASGKPILTDCVFKYDLIERYNAGMNINNASIKEWAEEIVRVKNMNIEEYTIICENAIKASKDYDYKNQSTKLMSMIKDMEENKDGIKR